MSFVRISTHCSKNFILRKLFFDHIIAFLCSKKNWLLKHLDLFVNLLVIIVFNVLKVKLKKLVFSRIAGYWAEMFYRLELFFWWVVVQELVETNFKLFKIVDVIDLNGFLLFDCLFSIADLKKVILIWFEIWYASLIYNVIGQDIFCIIHICFT